MGTGASRIAAGAAVIGLCVLGYYALPRSSSLEDEVQVRAAVEISSSSTDPDSGRVDFGLRVHNDGSERIRVSDVSARQNGLRVSDKGNADPPLVGAGRDHLVGLAIRLDCTQRALGADSRGGRSLLRTTLVVRSVHGSSHELTMQVEASSLTSVADTFCSIAPDQQTDLSGPVALPTPG